MSFRLFIHQNAVETIEQLCLALKEMMPTDPIIESPAFKLLCPQDATRDQYRSDFFFFFPEISDFLDSCLLSSLCLSVCLSLSLSLSVVTVLEFPELTEDYVHAIGAVWRSPPIEQIWLNRSTLQITDTSAIFLDRIQEVGIFFSLVAVTLSDLSIRIHAL
jgi:hypothetical protein